MNRAPGCANNLSQLGRLLQVHQARQGGRVPAATGGQFWLAFGTTTPPLIHPSDAEILSCPVKGDPEPGETDYRGPRGAYDALAPDDPLGADREGSHEEYGCILRKDGSVEIAPSVALWNRAAVRLQD